MTMRRMSTRRVCAPTWDWRTRCPSLSPTSSPPATGRRCRCGALVLRDKTGAVVTPLLGLKHECAKQREKAA